MVESYFNNILQVLFVSRAVTSFKLLKRVAGHEDGFIRIKCSLSDGGTFEFAEYIVIRKNRIPPLKELVALKNDIAGREPTVREKTAATPESYRAGVDSEK